MRANELAECVNLAEIMDLKREIRDFLMEHHLETKFLKYLFLNLTVLTFGSEVAEWLAHWLLVLEVPGSIPAGGEENLLVRTCFPSCHLQE